MRADLNANRGDRARLTLLPFLIVAICKAVPDFPMINAHYDDEAGAVTRLGTIHMGVATQTDAGLMVPVIRAAQDLNIRSEEHTSELQSLMRISYAVFCLKTKTKN